MPYIGTSITIKLRFACRIFKGRLSIQDFPIDTRKNPLWGVPIRDIPTGREKERDGIWYFFIPKLNGIFPAP
jgi:hypothetical protein